SASRTPTSASTKAATSSSCRIRKRCPTSWTSSPPTEPLRSTLLFVHGIGSTRTLWDPMVSLLDDEQRQLADLLSGRLLVLPGTSELAPAQAPSASTAEVRAVLTTIPGEDSRP